MTGVTRVDRTEGGEDVKGGGREKSIWRRRRRKIVADGTDGQVGTKALLEVLADLKNINLNI